MGMIPCPRSQLGMTELGLTPKAVCSSRTRKCERPEGLMGLNVEGTQSIISRAKGVLRSKLFLTPSAACCPIHRAGRGLGSLRR